MSEPARSYQVGGDHYTRLPIQPWDAMQAWMTTDEFPTGGVGEYRSFTHIDCRPTKARWKGKGV